VVSIDRRPLAGLRSGVGELSARVADALDR
jgi:hypothetical protein